MSIYKPISLETLAPWGESLVDPQLLLTADDVLRMGEASMGLEFVEGRLVKMSPTGRVQGKITYKVAKIVGGFIDNVQLGEVYGAETGFMIQRNPDTVLAPDLAFVRSDRLVNEGEDGFITTAPDLAIEIASSSQYKPEMAEKARLWLCAGTKLLWVIWPKTKLIDVWLSGVSEPKTLQHDDMLDGDHILPGFSQPVSSFFD